MKRRYMAICLVGLLLATTFGCIVEQEQDGKPTAQPTQKATTRKPPVTRIVWEPRSETMTDEASALSARSYLYWTFPSQSHLKNPRYEITFQEVSGSDANFYILDGRALSHFKNGESFQYIFKRENAVYFTCSVNVPSETHYIVLDNTDSWIKEKQIYLKVIVLWEEKRIIYEGDDKL